MQMHFHVPDRERERGLAYLPHWVPHPIVHHLRAQAIRIPHLFSAPGRGKKYKVAK